MKKFIDWLKIDLQLNLFKVIMPLVFFISFICLILQTNRYKKCKKIYTIAVINEYYQTVTLRKVVRYSYVINKKIIVKKNIVVSGGQFVVFPQNIESLPYSYLKNNYFLIEYCPNTKLTRLYLNKKIKKSIGKKFYGKIVDTTLLR